MSQTRRIVSLQANETIMAFPHWVARMNQLGAEKIPFLFILDFNLSSPLVLTFQEAKEKEIRFEINKNDTHPSNPLNEKHQISLQRFPIELDEYRIGFEKVKQAIQAGDTYLLNLCYSTRLSGSISLEDIFDIASAPYKLCMPGQFVVFSPEQFIDIKEGIIRTFPMKGTIDASVSDAEKILLARS